MPRENGWAKAIGYRLLRVIGSRPEPDQAKEQDKSDEQYSDHRSNLPAWNQCGPNNCRKAVGERQEDKIG